MISGINGYNNSAYTYSKVDSSARVQEDEATKKSVQVSAADKDGGTAAEGTAQKAEKVSAGTVQAKDASVVKTSDDVQSNTGKVNATTENKDAAKAPVKTDSKGIMDSFRGGKDLNIFGSTSRFNEIKDADSAVSDKKKDEILDRYTYFVNPTNSGLGTDADGTVRIKGAK